MPRIRWATSSTHPPSTFESFCAASYAIPAPFASPHEGHALIRSSCKAMHSGLDAPAMPVRPQVLIWTAFRDHTPRFGALQAAACTESAPVASAQPHRKSVTCGNVGRMLPMGCFSRPHPPIWRISGGGLHRIGTRGLIARPKGYRKRPLDRFQPKSSLRSATRSDMAPNLIFLRRFPRSFAMRSTMYSKATRSPT